MILSSSYRSAFAFALSSARRLRSGRERSNKATSDVHLLKEKKNKMKNTKMMMNKKISHLERREIWMNVLPSYTHTSFRWTLSGGLFLGSKHSCEHKIHDAHKKQSSPLLLFLAFISLPPPTHQIPSQKNHNYNSVSRERTFSTSQRLTWRVPVTRA